MATWFEHLLVGDHASRPSASAVPKGTLYSCSTHGLIYQSDGASSWSTWATLTSGVADILDLTTTEMVDTKVLAPDGAGGVEFRAPAAGGALGDGFTYLARTTDQNETTTGLHDDSTMQFAVTSGKHYIVEAYLVLSGNNTTGDAQWAFVVTAGTMDGRGWHNTETSTLSAIVDSTFAAVASATPTPVAVGVNAAADAGMPTMVRVWFAFRQNTSSGTFKVQFGVNTFSAGREARMMAGSYIRYRQTD